MRWYRKVCSGDRKLGMSLWFYEHPGSEIWQGGEGKHGESESNVRLISSSSKKYKFKLNKNTKKLLLFKKTRNTE